MFLNEVELFQFPFTVIAKKFEVNALSRPSKAMVVYKMFFLRKKNKRKKLPTGLQLKKMQKAISKKEVEFLLRPIYMHYFMKERTAKSHFQRSK